jgi:hypothetical protein
VVNPVVDPVGFTLALLVFWSRLYLRRHDPRETLVGAFLGLLGGLVTFGEPADVATPRQTKRLIILARCNAHGSTGADQG